MPRTRRLGTTTTIDEKSLARRGAVARMVELQDEQAGLEARFPGTKTAAEHERQRRNLRAAKAQPRTGRAAPPAVPPPPTAPPPVTKAAGEANTAPLPKRRGRKRKGLPPAVPDVANLPAGEPVDEFEEYAEAE